MSQKNIFSIDLESWVHLYMDSVQPSAFGSTSSQRKQLDNGYIPKATLQILDLLDKFGHKATFFVVGELFQWYPQTIEEIERRGHEIGFHTHTHPLLKNGKILEKELEQSISFLKRFNPMGFRAPQIHITRDSLDCLKRWGFRYSSSTYDDYHISDFEGLDEIPVSSLPYRKNQAASSTLPKNLTWKLLSKKIPFGSGFFISLLGARTSYFINRVNKENIPAILFIHPWQYNIPKEISNLSFKLKLLRHDPLALIYLSDIHKSLNSIFTNHQFTSFKEYYCYEQQGILG